MTKSGVRPVVRVLAHPPGTHKSAIRADMHALELIADTGESRWFGVDKAKITSRLRMVACGGFLNPKNELAKAWKRCRVGECR